MELTIQEIMEYEGLKWEVRDLAKRIELHNEQRTMLKAEKKELLKKIKETEQRYKGLD